MSEAYISFDLTDGISEGISVKDWWWEDGFLVMITENEGKRYINKRIINKLRII